MIDWPAVFQLATCVLTTLAIVYHNPILLGISIVLTFILFVLIPYYYGYYTEDDEDV